MPYTVCCGKPCLDVRSEVSVKWSTISTCLEGHLPGTDRVRNSSRISHIVTIVLVIFFHLSTNDIYRYPSIYQGQSISGRAMIKDTILIIKATHKFEKLVAVAAEHSNVRAFSLPTLHYLPHTNFTPL